jgi:Protein of unknown function (DUF2946)
MTLQGRRSGSVRTSLTFWLALVLCLQWGSAYLHCLRLATVWGGDIQICGVDGPDGHDGQTNAPAKGQKASSSVCPACGALHAIQAPIPPLITQPIGYALIEQPLHRAGLPPQPARAPPQQPRAPPIFI